MHTGWWRDSASHQAEGLCRAGDQVKNNIHRLPAQTRPSATNAKGTAKSSTSCRKTLLAGSSLEIRGARGGGVALALNRDEDGFPVEHGACQVV